MTEFAQILLCVILVMGAGVALAKCTDSGICHHEHTQAYFCP